MSTTRPTLADHLATAEVLVCCGSGGVGKTTSAAALGMQAALLGRRAVVVTIDPAKRLADALGVPGGLSNEPTRLDVPGEGELWALMLDTASTFDGLVRANAADAEQAERILANGFYRNVAGSLSGTNRVLEPLPSTDTRWASRSRSVVRIEHSSATRRPLP